MSDVAAARSFTRLFLTGLGWVAIGAWLGILALVGIVSHLSDRLPEALTTIAAAGALLVGIGGALMMVVAAWRT
jgi:hypothetical protein